MKIFIYLLIFCTSTVGVAQTAKLQFIHNSPDVLTEAVDVYFGNQKILDSLLFRTATPYLEINAGTNIVVAVQSPDLADTTASLFRDTLTFKPDSLYVIVLSGLISTSPYDSIEPFDLDVHRGRINANTSGKMDMLFHNGNLDGPIISIDELTQPINSLVAAIQYGDFTGYQQLDDKDYELKVYNAISQVPVAIFDAPFKTYGFADSAFVMVASGFIDSVKGKPGDSIAGIRAPLFGLWVATPKGGPLTELPVISGIGLQERLVGETYIYPNPTEDFIYMRNGGNRQLPVSAEVFTIAGQSMLYKKIEPGQADYHRLDVRAIHPGLYVLRLQYGSGKFHTTKVLIH